MKTEQNGKLREGSESEYYAGSIAGRYIAPEKRKVTAEIPAARKAAGIWNRVRTVVLYVLAAAGAYALTDPGIRERLRQIVAEFLLATGIR